MHGAILFYKPFNYSPILALLSDYLLAWYTYLLPTYLSALNVP
jgi:hypothetical protein